MDSGEILLCADEEVLPRGCSDEEGEVVLGRDLLGGTKRESRRFSMTIILGGHLPLHIRECREKR